MRRSIILCTIMILMCVSLSCQNKKTQTYPTTEEVKTKELEQLIEDVRQEESDVVYEYANYFDKDILWKKYDDWTDEMPLPVKGSVTWHKSVERALELSEEETKGKVYAIWLVESVNCNVNEIYNKVIKILNAETEFGKKTDKEICEILELKKKDFIKSSGSEEAYYFEIKLFLSKEQIEKMKCPDDMAVQLFWLDREEQLEITQEGIDFYENDIIPVKYYIEYPQFRSEYIDKESVEKMINEGKILYWDWSLMEKQWEVF